MQERLQKILSKAGYGSRRKCENLISDGRVCVNGQIALLGSKADASSDAILLDGKKITEIKESICVLLNKPRNVISSLSQQDSRETVRDLVPILGNLFPVGRLDADSEGLILLTNDGDLANRLTHPRYEHEKEYRVLVASFPTERQLATLRRGVVLTDGFQTQHAEVRIIGKHGKGAWLSVILREGHKRQIREMGNIVGLPVVRIIRIRMGALRLGNLKPREWRYLTEREIKLLKNS